METTTTFWLWEFLGRLHPMIVHFPIGILVVAIFLEILTLGGKRTNLREGIYWMLLIGTLTAIFSVVFGLILHNVENQSGEWVEYHEWGGILTAVASGIALFFYQKFQRKSNPSDLKFYRIALSIAVIALTITGHLGAGLTHGKDYLSSTFPWNKADENSGEARLLLTQFSKVSQQDQMTRAELDKLNMGVRAIFAHNCYKCHSSEKQKGDLALDTEEAILRGGETGEVIVMGNSNQSDLIRRISLPRSHDDAMPPKGKLLTEDEIDLIRLWVDLGAHWSDERLKIFPEAELALTKPALPPVSGTYSHPIDRWINQYFAQQDMDWPEPISDRLFIRRVYLDIIGLLPSAEQVEAFTAESAPAKRLKLIQSLLNQSGDYSRHWLSFWNDLLRNDYSGTGFITGGRKQITPWLYSALMENKPYDEMVRQLLNPTSETEGFIKGIRWRGTVNSSQKTEMQAAQNVSQSLLGVNLKCASCHNSFVSNLTLDEAYNFASIFADSTLEVHRCDKPTGRMAQSAFLYPQLGEVEAATLKERLEQLATVVVQPDNGRLYRTIINRYWALLFGRGIISPVDEMDNRPWNQELLDWLAADFIESGYDLKNLLLTIMTSRAYQLPSVAYEARNDLMDQRFVFRGPAVRRMSAEQFADAMAQLNMPVYHGQDFDPTGENLPAQWIWHRERVVDRDVLPGIGPRFFRYEFDLPANKKIKQAELLITADNSFQIYLNEAAVAEGFDWREVHKLEVGESLKNGGNIFAIRGENTGELPNPAGILLHLLIDFEDGTSQEVFSNTDWKSLAETPIGDNWTRRAYDDSEWARVRRYGSFGKSFWGKLPAFTHQPDKKQAPFVRASMVKLDPFLKALGRPTRENVTTVRDDRATLLQAMELTNGETFNQIVSEGAEHWWKESNGNIGSLSEDLYMAALGRKPTDDETELISERLEDKPGPEAVKDVLWAVLLLPEFQLIR